MQHRNGNGRAFADPFGDLLLQAAVSWIYRKRIRAAALDQAIVIRTDNGQQSCFMKQVADALQPPAKIRPSSHNPPPKSFMSVTS
ncbi:hypothetical protein HMSSN036_81020 [Paenibacillus macerans]|nr:hypothetical protein HMSSN036_81020 [Paenibacillus macerans]